MGRRTRRQRRLGRGGWRPRHHVWLRERRNRGLYAFDTLHGDTIGQDIDRRPQERRALVVASRRQDPTKVDRSAAYICRQMAKSIVKSGLSKRALVQLSYAIGVAKPLSVFVETYDSENGDLSADDITNILKIAFDCRPGALGVSLALREPKYQETAAYCHFGRKPYTKDGLKFFEWENAKDLSKYKTMTCEQVAAELKASNYLTKWVD